MTPEELRSVIEAPDRKVKASLLLLDENEENPQDITDDLDPIGSSISRGIYNTIHGTATFRIKRELQWGYQRLKLRMRWSSQYLGLGFSDDDWVNMGIWIPSVPEVQGGTSPRVFTVQCFDKLDILNNPHGQTAYFLFETPLLTTMGELITGAGESNYLLDPSNQATPPTGIAFLIAENWTTLGIINDGAGRLSYRGLWVDQRGYYRSEPYDAPSAIAPSWTFNAGSDSNTWGTDRTLTSDFYRAPNVWVFVDSDPLYKDDSGVAFPHEGVGVYTVTNPSDGPTSVAGRGGRYITKTESLECAGDTLADRQASLMQQGDRIVEADKKLDRTLTARCGPMPLLWHFSTVEVTDADLGLNAAKFLVTDWTLPLDGGDMGLTMREV